MQNFHEYWLPALLGFLGHIFLIKLPSVKARAKAANIPFSVWGYLKDDSIALIGNMICIAMLVVGIDELFGLNHYIAKLVKWLFFFVALGGSSIFMYAFGKVDKVMRKVVDAKTNIADERTLTKENKEVLKKIETDAGK